MGAAGARRPFALSAHLRFGQMDRGQAGVAAIASFAERTALTASGDGKVNVATDSHKPCRWPRTIGKPHRIDERRTAL
jgi:hypothetical protein